MLKDIGFDVTITQRGSVYDVGGKDAKALYDKMQKIPAAAQTLTISDLKNGTFTIEKIMGDAKAPQAAAN